MASTAAPGYFEVVKLEGGGGVGWGERGELEGGVYYVIHLFFFFLHRHPSWG